MSRRLPDHAERIRELLRDFKLTTAAEQLVPRLVADGHEPALATIAEVFALEHDARHARRVARLRRASKLSVGKTFETLDQSRLPRQLEQLRSGDFLDDAINVLAFGLPGVSKSHALSALEPSRVSRRLSNQGESRK